ncbi:MAG: hypothetical protein J6O56_03870 [Bacilli bacterium]|nr:hypothetical protein [Bacilli bacterium]
MNIFKKIALFLLLLIVMCLCGTLVLKFFDLILKLKYENIWLSGFKVGFVAWIGTIINEYYHIRKKKSK